MTARQHQPINTTTCRLYLWAPLPPPRCLTEHCTMFNHKCLTLPTKVFAVTEGRVRFFFFFFPPSSSSLCNFSRKFFHRPDCRVNQLATDSYNSTFMSVRKRKQMKAFFPCVWWMFVWLNYHWNLTLFFFVVFAQQNRLTVNSFKHLRTDFTPAFRFSRHRLRCLCFLIDPKKSN